ncbi:MAG: UvrD-helicase domain-containing protein [Bacilli bacterium]|nr:UvrD-helicase domain-containing protein [Bacilli bacterium]
MDFIQEFNLLMSKSQFISNKEVCTFKKHYEETFNQMNKYNEEKLLEHYCKKSNIDYASTKSALELYLNLSQSIIEHNKTYINMALIENKEYFDEILAKDNPNILLDQEQREVILNNEDYSLVVAGAGAGKTTTIIAKVKYLVEKKGIAPDKILVVSFTNKAVDELKHRINKTLNIPCRISTFHACGYSIVSRINEKKYRVISDGGLFSIIREYVTKNIYYDKTTLKSLILFFGYYIDAIVPESMDEFIEQTRYTDYTTLRSNLNEINLEIIDSRKKCKKTIKNEIAQSYEEVQIANYLYLNGIEYDYEPTYPYHIPDYNKIYTPDFCIYHNGQKYYLEHFGITESGENNRYSPLELAKYKGNIASKILMHQKHKTKLLMTYSSYNDGRSLLQHLHEILVQANIDFHPRSEEEVFDKLKNIEHNKYFDKLIRLICSFIQNFKTKDFTIDDFGRMNNSSTNVRTKIFLDICEKAYLEYERRLRETNRVDFEDMINESAKLLKEAKNVQENINLEYIIVDEYQDISRQRFNLTKELSNLTQAKIMAVGDDWQSIYAFAGSEIQLFTKFKEEMGYADILYITHTYRNSQELIDNAGKFVQENPSQIRKKLISPKTIQKPIVVYTYCDDKKKNIIKGTKGGLDEKAKLLESVIEKILLTTKDKNSDILVIGRYNFDGFGMGTTPYFSYDNESRKFSSNKYPEVKLTFLTAHSSKGLTYDNVIIINASNEVYGFPSQIERDPVMNFVVYDDKSYRHAEERRLFYVAMTRTKNRVFIIAPESKPSEFVLELLKYDNVILHGSILEKDINHEKLGKNCPICGYPLQLKDNKTYGLPLYVCTNETEICDFMTNDLHGGANSIKICPNCEGGFLIIRKRNNENIYFLGCTNFYEKDSCKYSEPLK